MEALDALADWLSKAHVGFAKLEHKLAAKRGGKKVRDPKAVAAAVGMKKYGKKKMEAEAHAGKKLGKAEAIQALTAWLAKSADAPLNIKRTLMHHAIEYQKHAQAGNQAKATQHAMHHNAALRRMPMGQRSGISPLPMSKGSKVKAEKGDDCYKSLTTWVSKAMAKKKKIRKDDPPSVAGQGVSASSMSPSGTSTIANYFRNR